MVAHLKFQVHAPGLISVLLLTAAFMPAEAAEPLPDPTRPPMEITAPAGHDHAAEQVAHPAASRGLQFIIIAPDRRAAIINGHNVKLGGKYGDATLVEVNEGSIVLQDAQGKRISFNMFPGVGIKAGTPPARQQPEKVEDGPIINKPVAAESSPQAAPQEGK